VHDGGNQVSFEVAGFPPPEGEAISMLSAGHPHAPRIRLLLEVARHAFDEQGFTPIQDGPVALDVVVRCPAGGNPADATNLLGGIADVLEEKSRRGPLERLEADIRKWINEWNKDPKPFTWVKTADEIFETLAAYCGLINASGH
jgi:hypothetical protein